MEEGVSDQNDYKEKEMYEQKESECLDDTYLDEME